MYSSSRRLVTSMLFAAVASQNISAAEFTYRPVSRPIVVATESLTGSGLPELEYVPPDPTTIVGGNFVGCTAYSRTGGRCYDYGDYYTRTGLRRKGCIGVTYNAHCSCNTETGATQGNCTYIK
jgi:hypothetical protein